MQYTMTIDTDTKTVEFSNGMKVGYSNVHGLSKHFENWGEKSQKIWCEVTHRYESSERISEICSISIDGTQSIIDVLLENIYLDVYNYDKECQSSDSYGIAIIHDLRIARVVRNNGWRVQKVDDNLWVVFGD